MADSIELYNGVNNINVNTLDVLREPNQQLANAIATGPQDEFFSALEECNRMMRMHNDLNPKVLSVTPSWNWRPGSLDIVKDYVAKQLMLQKKSSGLGKYMYRTADNARYRLNYVARKLELCEEKKRMLKREGYQHDVDIDEYVVKLVDFCDKLEESINQAHIATGEKVLFEPYIHIPEHNQRQAMLYISCYVNPGEMNVYQDQTLIQKIDITGIKIMFYCPLRKIMKYLDKKLSSNLAVQYRGINDAEIVNMHSYRTMQATFHPYVAQPTTNSYSDDYLPIQWASTCFSDFTDNVRNSFHNLNFVVLAMELLEWAGYYNTTHSNPYNNVALSHIGMPSSFSKAYQAVTSRDTQNCSSRLWGKIYKSEGKLGSKKWIEESKEMLHHCIDIDCIWRHHCGLYQEKSGQTKRLSNEDYVFTIESILGHLLEQWDEEMVIEALRDDFGCYLRSSLPEDENRISTGIYTYEDVFNYLISAFDSLYVYNDILDETNYWPKETKIKVTLAEQLVPDEDEIKKQMLQWATERSA